MTKLSPSGISERKLNKVLKNKLQGSKTADGKIKLGKFVGNVKLRVFYPATATGNKSNEVEYTFAVGKAPQTITYPEITSKRVGDPDFNLNIGSATSGEALEYEIISGSNLVQLVNGTLKFLSMGQVTVRIRQKGNDFYEAAETTRIFNIGRGAQTISFPAILNQTMTANSAGLTLVLGVGFADSLRIEPKQCRNYFGQYFDFDRFG